MTAPGGRRPSAADALAAAALGLAVLVLARASFQERFANDGPVLASAFVLEPRAVHWQIAYLPLARGLRALLGGAGDPFEPLRLLQALAAGVGAGATVLLARALGAGRGAALLAAALVALSPHAWFFATSVEVHALTHGAVALAAAATVLGPWRRAPGLALALAALLYGALCLVHRTTPLLGLGWLGLVAVARRDAGRPLSARALLLGVGPLLLAAGLACYLASQAWFAARTGTSGSLDLELVAIYRRTSSRADWAWAGFLRPLALVLPLAAAGALAWARRDRLVALALLGAVLPPLAFQAWWGVPEGGGYLLGQAPFHAVLAAAALAALRARSAAVAPALVLAQAGIAWWGIRAFDATLHPEARLALVRAELGERGVLASLGWLAPDVRVWLPEVRVLDLTEPVLAAYEAGLPPDELAREWAPALAELLEEAPVALDTSWTEGSWELAGRDPVAYARAFQAAVLEAFAHRRASRDGWTLAVLARPAPG